MKDMTLNLPSAVNGRFRIENDGKIVHLFEDEKEIMNNMQWDDLLNDVFMDNAIGDVLIIGLGIGLILDDLIGDDTISSITILEKYQEIIDLVAPYYESLSDKINIINGDVFQWEPEKRFDAIKLAIWSKGENDIVDSSESKTLFDKAKDWLKNPVMDFIMIS